MRVHKGKQFLQNPVKSEKFIPLIFPRNGNGFLPDHGGKFFRVYFGPL